MPRYASLDVATKDYFSFPIGDSEYKLYEAETLFSEECLCNKLLNK